MIYVLFWKEEKSLFLITNPAVKAGFIILKEF